MNEGHSSGAYTLPYPVCRKSGVQLPTPSSTQSHSIDGMLALPSIPSAVNGRNFEFPLRAVRTLTTQTRPARQKQRRTKKLRVIAPQACCPHAYNAQPFVHWWLHTYHMTIHTPSYVMYYLKYDF